MTAATTSAADERFPLLDGCRALAAVAVVITHVAFLTDASARHPLGPEMARLNTGVSVFFVLSGFLLYRPFVAARLAGGSRPETIPYLWRRALRIYPAYWVALAATILLLPQYGTGGVQGAFLWGSLLHVFSPAHFFAPVQQAWTLGVEVCFYAFLPVWAWLVRRLPGATVRTELLALAGLWAAGNAWQLVLLQQSGSLESVFRNGLPGWFDHFAIGMALAVVSAARGRAAAWLARVPAGAAWATALGALLVMSRGLGIPRTGEGSFYLSSADDFALHVLGTVLAVGVLLPAMFGPADRGIPRRILANRAVAWVGVVSYGVYLWHETILDRFVAWRWRAYLDIRPEVLDRGPAPFELTLGAVLLASVAVATVSWLALEQPVLRLKRLVRSTSQVLDGPLLPRLLVLAVLGLAVRVLFVLGWRRFASVGGDPYWYSQGANLLADGQGFVHVFRLDATGVHEPGADHPAGYLVALALASFAGFRSLLAHQLWSCVLGAAAIPFAGLAGARLGGQRAGLLAAAFVAVSPLVWVYDGILAAETLAVTAICASTWLALKARDEGGRRVSTLAWLGVALGVLAMARAEAILLAPVVLAAVAWRAWRPLAAGVLGVALLVGPWTMANLVRFDRPSTLSTQLGTTLLHANCDDVYYGAHVGWWSFRCAADLPLPPGDASEADHAYREAAVTYVGDHLDRLPVVVLARVGRTVGLWDPVGQVDLDRVEGRPKGVAVAGMLTFYVTAALAVVGWRRLRRAGWSVRALVPLWTPLALVLLTVVAFYGTTRFRAVAEPALALLAAVGLAGAVAPRRPPAEAGDEDPHLDDPSGAGEPPAAEPIDAAIGTATGTAPGTGATVPHAPEPARP